MGILFGQDKYTVPDYHMLCERYVFYTEKMHLV